MLLLAPKIFQNAMHTVKFWKVPWNFTVLQNHEHATECCNIQLSLHADRHKLSCGTMPYYSLS